jgi:hypothetical protein
MLLWRYGIKRAVCTASATHFGGCWVPPVLYGTGAWGLMCDDWVKLLAGHIHHMCDPPRVSAQSQRLQLLFTANRP